MKSCTKCGTTDRMTRHHILPKRYHKKDKEAMKKTVILCEDCHSNIEVVLGIAERDELGTRRPLRPWLYLALNDTFLREGFETARDFALTISRSHRHERQAKAS